MRRRIPALAAVTALALSAVAAAPAAMAAGSELPDPNRPECLSYYLVEALGGSHVHNPYDC